MYKYFVAACMSSFSYLIILNRFFKKSNIKTLWITFFHSIKEFSVKPEARLPAMLSCREEKACWELPSPVPAQPQVQISPQQISPQPLIAGSSSPLSDPATGPWPMWHTSMWHRSQQCLLCPTVRDCGGQGHISSSKLCWTEEK